MLKFTDLCLKYMLSKYLIYLFLRAKSCIGKITGAAWQQPMVKQHGRKSRNANYMDMFSRPVPLNDTFQVDFTFSFLSLFSQSRHKKLDISHQWIIHFLITVIYVLAIKEYFLIFDIDKVKSRICGSTTKQDG